MNANSIIQCLKFRYHNEPGAWLLIPELRAGVGWGKDAMRKIDLYAFRIWGGNKHLKYDRIAYEIKMSKTDFYKDTAEPIKQRPAILMASQFYYVAPKGVIPIKSLPLDCGLIEIHEPGDGLVPIITVPSATFDYAPNWCFVASLVRSVQENKQLAEGPTKGLEQEVE